MIKYYPVVRTTYAAAENVQHRLSRALLDAKRDKSEAPMALLGYEFEPTYTVGRRQNGRIPDAEKKELSADGRAQVIETDRGGHTTFHGPGQLVMYPILDLNALRIKVRDYVCILEKSIVAVMQRDFGIDAEQRSGAGMNGVWITETDQKVASVGVHVQRNVTTHGLALNVETDNFWWERIVPCNLPGVKMVSLNDYAPQDPTVECVGDLLAAEIGKRLGREVERLTPEDSQRLLQLSATSEERSPTPEH